MGLSPLQWHVNDQPRGLGIIEQIVDGSAKFKKAAVVTDKPGRRQVRFTGNLCAGLFRVVPNHEPVFIDLLQDQLSDELSHNTVG